MNSNPSTSNSNSKSNNNDHLVGAGVIWSFWEGSPPDVVLRCFESIRMHNKSRPFIILSKATLPKYLDEATDYPLFHNRRGTPDDFSKVQYLADWVRLTLLDKYGGIWLDASVICTSAVDNWITGHDEIECICDSDEDEPGRPELPALAAPKVNQKLINMFPMHANGNVHGNWAIAAIEPGNPVVQAWREEMNQICDETGPGQIPTHYIDRVMQGNAAVRERWNHPEAPPLPYLWVYLALQVVLDRSPELHSHICLHSCVDGPMYRRYKYNITHGITDGTEVSQRTADDLATEPLALDGPDRWFIKLVGTDRQPVQDHLDQKTYCEDSGIGKLSQLRARTIVYGANLRTLANLDRVRAAVHLIVATRAFGEKIEAGADEAKGLGNTDITSRRKSKRQSVLMDFSFEDESTLDEEQTAPRKKRDSILVGFNTTTSPMESRPAKRESICLDFYLDPAEWSDDDDDESASPEAATDGDELGAARRESIYCDLPGVSPSMVTIL